jgi:hypothetical protein
MTLLPLRLNDMFSPRMTWLGLVAMLMLNIHPRALPLRRVITKEGVNLMRHLIAFLCRLSVCVFTRSVLVAGLGFCMVSSVLADDITVSEQTFGCILDWPKVRNTRFKHSDPVKLKEAMHILRDSIPDREYPIGTILQLVPFEAMVKHPHEKFPKTNGWEFFALDVSEAGTKIRDRGDNVVNLSQGVTCLSCHQPAAKFDLVCEKGHGCAPIPFDDQKIAELQRADSRCGKK